MHELMLDISLREQRLKVVNGDDVTAEYQVATARKGAGEVMDSERTPRGWHAVCAKSVTAALPALCSSNANPRARSIRPSCAGSIPNGTGF